MNKISRKSLLLSLLFAPLAQVASAAAAPATEESLDEVVVNGAKLNELLQEMVKVENKFFKRYNELNTNDDFDTHCAMETRAGTAIRRRYCHVGYQEKALQVEGQDYALFLINNFSFDQGSTGGTTYKLNNEPPTLVGAPPVAASVTIEARRKDYQQNVREVVAQHPELLELLRERDALGKRYEAGRRKLWGVKRTPAEEAATAAPVTP